MVQILVLYYSTGGNTEALAKAIADGARALAQVSVKRVDHATVNDLTTCDGAAFGSPNYFGYMAGQMKDYFDKAWSVRTSIAGKPYAAFTSGGGTSSNALTSIENVASFFKMEKAADGLVSSRKPSEEDLEKCRNLGKKLAEATVAKTGETPVR